VAADRLNLIRVMPAQGWWLGSSRPVRRFVPNAKQTEDGKRDQTVVPLRRRPAAGDGSPPLDCVIVGGGVIGLACAWRLARADLRVRVLERDAPGAGASFVAAGMLAPVGEVTWGEEALLRMTLESARSWPQFAGELEASSEVEVGYRPSGALHVALDRDETEELRRRFQLMESLGLEASWLRPGGCRELEPGLSTGVAAGVHVPGEAAVDPRAVVAALAAAVEREGGQVVPAADVIGALDSGGRIAGVVTADGREHQAQRVVLAAGAWSGATSWLPSWARPPVRPVKGQVVVLRDAASAPVCERMLASERVYLVPRTDGRLVIGATVEERGFDVLVTAGGVFELLREAYRILPDVAELQLVETVASVRPGTPDNLPLIGPSEIDGLLLATGHFRNGILLAPYTAEAVAAAICGGDPPAGIEAAHPGRLAKSEQAEVIRARPDPGEAGE